MRSSGGPGSVSTGTQASSGKSGTVSADARVPCESAKCSSETDRGSADPPKTAILWGLAEPLEAVLGGSAEPLSCGQTLKGFSHPRRSTPSSRPQMPPKPKGTDKQSKAERNLVLSNQYSALSDDEMELSSVL